MDAAKVREIYEANKDLLHWVDFEGGSKQLMDIDYQSPEGALFGHLIDPDGLKTTWEHPMLKIRTDRIAQIFPSHHKKSDVIVTTESGELFDP